MRSGDRRTGDFHQHGRGEWGEVGKIEDRGTCPGPSRMKPILTTCPRGDREEVARQKKINKGIICQFG